MSLLHWQQVYQQDFLYQCQFIFLVLHHLHSFMMIRLMKSLTLRIDEILDTQDAGSFKGSYRSCLARWKNCRDTNDTWIIEDEFCRLESHIFWSNILIITLRSRVLFNRKEIMGVEEREPKRDVKRESAFGSLIIVGDLVFKVCLSSSRCWFFPW